MNDRQHNHEKLISLQQ